MLSNQEPTAITDILHQTDAALYSIQLHIQRLQKIRQIVKNNLPTPLASRIQVLNWQRGTLSLGCEQAAIVSRLRFMIPQLRDQLRQYSEFYGLTAIEYKVLSPAPRLIKPKQRYQRQMSAQVEGSLRQLAASVEDKKLQAALQRLARHSQSLQD